MARTRNAKPTKRARPARPTKPTRPRTRSPRVAPPRDPEQLFMAEAAAEMMDIISCPMLVAEDHADRLADIAMDAELGHDLALLSARLHPHSQVAPVLADIAQVLDRHRRELDALLDRLMPLVDHDEPHDHIVPDDDAVKEMLFALFGDPRDAEPGDDGNRTR